MKTLTNETQIEKTSRLLKEVATQMSVTNRKDLKEAMKISRVTLKKYLDGDIADIETAVAILLFCRNIIKKREAALEAA